jgi:hypothetical protein
MPFRPEASERRALVENAPRMVRRIFEMKELAAPEKTGYRRV